MLLAFMLVVGVAMASWVTRTSAVRDAVDASTAQRGVILVRTGLVVIAASAPAASGVGVFAGLFLFGLGGGLGEIGLNIEGAEVENILGRPVVPLLHGFFSLGTVLGAGVGITMTAVDFPVLWHLLMIAAVLIVTTCWAAPGIPHGVGVVARVARTRTAGRPHSRSVWREHTVALIGVIVLAMAFAEGAANDCADPVW